MAVAHPVILCEPGAGPARGKPDGRAGEHVKLQPNGGVALPDFDPVHFSTPSVCRAGLHWNARGVLVDGRPRQELTEEALDFVRLLMDAPIPRIAIENPVGCISTRIRKPSQIIQPYEYGDNASKKTCLWLKGLPPLKPTRRVAGRMVMHNGRQVERWENQTDSGQNKLPPSADRWKDRARTYQGWADAMSAQWGGSIYDLLGM